MTQIESVNVIDVMDVSRLLCKFLFPFLLAGAQAQCTYRAEG